MNPLFRHENMLVDLVSPEKRRPYGYDDATEKNVHYGQLKLLLSEMYLLSKHRDLLPKSYVLIYVGSSPGYHIPFLVDCLPEISHCHCYDQANTPLRDNDRFTLHRHYFTDEDAYRHSEMGEDIVLISDIRSEDHDVVKTRVEERMRGMDPKVIKKEAEDEMERSIWDNMQSQQRWMHIMRPLLSLLKFRLPWKNVDDFAVNDEILYNDGELTFQPFMTQRGTETKLLVKQEEVGTMRLYNLKHYEEVCAHHNHERSLRHYRIFEHWPDEDIGPPELLDDWDSSAMYFTLLCYFVFHSIEKTRGEVMEFVRECTKSIAYWFKRDNPDLPSMESLVDIRNKPVKSSARRHRDTTSSSSSSSFSSSWSRGGTGKSNRSKKSGRR